MAERFLSADEQRNEPRERALALEGRAMADSVIASQAGVTLAQLRAWRAEPEYQEALTLRLQHALAAYDAQLADVLGEALDTIHKALTDKTVSSDKRAALAFRLIEGPYRQTQKALQGAVNIQVNTGKPEELSDDTLTAIAKRGKR